MRAVGEGPKAKSESGGGWEEKRAQATKKKRTNYGKAYNKRGIEPNRITRQWSKIYKMK